jgi:hypothetical protein
VTTDSKPLVSESGGTPTGGNLSSVPPPAAEKSPNGDGSIFYSIFGLLIILFLVFFVLPVLLPVAGVVVAGVIVLNVLGMLD